SPTGLASARASRPWGFAAERRYAQRPSKAATMAAITTIRVVDMPTAPLPSLYVGLAESPHPANLTVAADKVKGNLAGCNGCHGCAVPTGCAGPLKIGGDFNDACQLARPAVRSLDGYVRNAPHVRVDRRQDPACPDALAQPLLASDALRHGTWTHHRADAVWRGTL